MSILGVETLYFLMDCSGNVSFISDIYFGLTTLLAEGQVF